MMILTLILLKFFSKFWNFVLNVLLHVFLIFPFNAVFSQTNKKIERITLIIKEGIECDIDNYKPISLLSCFSKMFEKIIYICLYRHLYENNLFYNTVCFPEGSLCTKHVIMQLVDQINSSFEKICLHWKFLLTYPKHSTLLMMSS